MLASVLPSVKNFAQRAKVLINREQNDACISFAKREELRPKGNDERNNLEL